MNNMERLFAESSNAKEFAAGYLDYLANLLRKLDLDEITAFIDEMDRCHKSQNNIFIVGNGGSAATASHMVNDLGMDVLKKAGIEVPFRAMSLTDNIPLIMAISNDDSYDNVFVNQLKIYYKEGDILIGISASGNSPNIINAAEWVKQRNGKVIGLTGFDGGKLKEISDIVVHVDTPKGEYGPVEDIHLVINHLLAMWFQNKMKVR
ncbi:MAG: SIS domain-containing protein [Clostridia bacterium]|nr:SIS domain-containing protein [Clostridia bacterium]